MSLGQAIFWGVAAWFILGLFCYWFIGIDKLVSEDGGRTFSLYRKSQFDFFFQKVQ